MFSQVPWLGYCLLLSLTLPHVGTVVCSDNTSHTYSSLLFPAGKCPLLMPAGTHGCLRSGFWGDSIKYQSVSTDGILALYTQLCRDYNCDSTTVRLRYDGTTTHSTTTNVIEIMRRVRFYDEYDTTTTKNWHDCSFFAPSNGSRCARCVVVGSYSYRIVESQL